MGGGGNTIHTHFSNPIQTSGSLTSSNTLKVQNQGITHAHRTQGEGSQDMVLL